jgi:phosphoribosylformylglycinamidine synthase subunit PurL
MTTHKSGGADHGMDEATRAAEAARSNGRKGGNGAREAPAPRAGDPAITPDLVAEHKLSPEEYGLIVEAVGREPTYTELGVFSALWSEHCGYKNSRPLLRQLPTKAPWVLQGPGENAGVISIGDGYAIAFKIESHNHPSAVEPYEGAATGVGGILRDVFTMGARPIATLDSLRFGSLTRPRVRYLFAGVVKGIGDYGNAVGIPNIGGEVYFDDAYEGNPLVNAMAIGLMKEDELIRGEASGIGNPILAVGARTGRDGIHGATFASDELTAESEANRPQVQVGDPFTEKLLLEASLELIRSGHIVGIQDMGAAGLASSSTEMAARSGTGVDIDTALVPVREEGMTPYEILLSESQERMLVVAKAGHEHEVIRILEKWELEAAVIGKVTDDGLYRVRDKGVVVCELPGEPLVNECPTYTREGVESAAIRKLRQWTPAELDTSHTEAHPGKVLLRLLGSPNIASRRWIYNQYDTTVRTNTVYAPGGDAGVLRIRGTNRGLAATVDCNGRYVYLNPRRGAMIAVAEAARNIVCVGARPRAITNNLNFGNPLKADVYYQLREAVLGMGEACAAFETPVTGGNVSLYNESPTGAIYPTPTVGMIGVLDDIENFTAMPFRQQGDAIILFGSNTDELGGSEYLKVVHGLVAGDAPNVDLAGERRLQELVLSLTGQRVLQSAHDTAEGGLAVALAECAIAGDERWGVDVELHDTLPSAALLFGEAQGRIIVSCRPERADTIVAEAAGAGVPAAVIGHVGSPGGSFVIRTPGAAKIDVPTDSLHEVWSTAIPRLMEKAVAS